MKKVLFLTHNCYFVNKFLLPQIDLYKSLGYQVDLASSLDLEEPPQTVDNFFDIGIKQSPFKFKRNFKAFRNLEKIINDYSIINCHTPMGGVLGRLLKRKHRDLQVVYTAHGFHFFKGSSLFSWLAYYPVEKFLSRYTDKQIVINQEDYDLLFTKKFKSKIKALINGVGLERFKVDYNKSRVIKENLNISESDLVLCSIGQLNKNKNQEFMIEMMHHLKNEFPLVKLLIIGEGEIKEQLQKMIDDYRLNEVVLLIGYTDFIPEHLDLAQIVLSASIREGLPKNIMEALYMGKPCIVSNCRGNRDLITTGYNGYVMKENTVKEFKNGLKDILENYEKYSQATRESVTPYLLENVIEEYRKIYSK